MRYPLISGFKFQIDKACLRIMLSLLEKSCTVVMGTACRLLVIVTLMRTGKNSFRQNAGKGTAVGRPRILFILTWILQINPIKSFLTNLPISSKSRCDSIETDLSISSPWYMPLIVVCIFTPISASFLVIICSNENWLFQPQTKNCTGFWVSKPYLVLLTSNTVKLFCLS